MTYPFLPQTTPVYAAVGRLVSGNIYAAILLAAMSADIAVPQVTTVNVTGATNSSTYSMRVVATGEGWGFSVDRTVEYPSDGSATQQEIADGLAAAARADAQLGVVANAVAGTNNLALTCTRGGSAYTFTVTFPSNPSSNLTSTATTAAADAPTYYIGRCAEVVGSSGPNPTVQPVQPLSPATLAYAVTHGAGATYAGTFTVQDPEGIEQSSPWSASAGANLAATLTAINGAITTQVAAITGAVVATSSPNVTLSLPLGWGSIVPLTTSATGGGGSPAMTATATEGDAVPAYLFIRDPQDQAPIRGQPTNTIATVDGGQPRMIPVVIGGGLNWAAEIASGATCTPGAQVYVETAAGANQGRITPTPSTTAAPMRTRTRVPVVFSQTDPSGGASAAITI
jgi:hypothetical protein